jgi:hypothetical protein
MAAHRKSLAELEANGSLAKDPQRFRDRTPPPEPKAPLKRVPPHLDDAQKKVWKELLAAAPDGVIGTCDAPAFEVVVRATIDMRAGLLTKQSERQSLFNMYGKFGLVPGDRTRFNGPAIEKDKGSEWDEL